MPPRQLVKQVGQAIAKRRKQNNLTQAKVAEKLGIETETVSRLETGAISPTLERLEQFSKLYRCPVVAFFRDDLDDDSSLSRTIIDVISPLKKNERALLLSFLDDLAKLFQKREL
ncbi:MAG: helix-turn-helix domain-containing protein [Deltaproteobacteria bacterium]|jgi:transcriptional regulator with XRE-family HTH domain|nr:helix-turn-helix domain-containing protein [Deltaproteobacteria bacterium]